MKFSMSRHPEEHGFSTLEVAIVLLVAIILLGVSQFVLRHQADKASVPVKAKTERQDDTQPPLTLKSIGITLDHYSSVTHTAGDITFTQGMLRAGLLFTDFGYEIPASISATGQTKRSPQPAFIVPIGTKVRSLVDGEVVKVQKLSGGDYSIQMASDDTSMWRYETRHVSTPRVDEGDEVAAGQVIAEVGAYESQHNNGLGMVEIGILHSFTTGAVSEYVCPFNYLDPSIKQEIYSELTGLYREWEAYRGDSTLYDEDRHAVPGCYTLDPIRG